MPRSQEYNLNAAEMGTTNKGYVADSNGVSEPQSVRTPDGKITAKTVEGLPAERQQWDRPIEFLLSCIAMSVGLGNLWRFPYTAYINGGGAFLIHYLIVLFFIGKPPLGVTNGPTLPTIGPIPAGHTSASKRALDLHRMRMLKKFDPNTKNLNNLERQGKGIQGRAGKKGTVNPAEIANDIDVMQVVNERGVVRIFLAI